MAIGRKSSIFKINGEAMISPQECKVEYDSLADENSGRTMDGVMHINWIWRKIRKVNIKMPPITNAEWGEIVSQVQGQEYELTYLDPVDGVRTIRAYTSKSSSELHSGVLYGGLVVGAAFNAIEMEGER